MFKCRPNFFKIVHLVVLTVLFLPISTAAQSEPPQVAIESITAEELTGLLRFFSSDLLEGRVTGTRGFDLGAEFIASQLAVMGVKPAGPDGSYFQTINLIRPTVTDDIDFALIRSGETFSGYVVGTDYAPSTGSSSWNLEAQLVFAGFGITSTDPAWDDYADLVVEGKIVVIVDQFPGVGVEDSPFGSMWSGRRGTFAKTRLAARNGAIGMIVVPHPRSPGSTRIRFAPGGGRLSLPGRSRASSTFPSITVSTSVSKDIFGSEALATVVEQMESRNRPAGITLENARASAHVTIEEEKIPTRNIVAIIEGTDLKDEYVLLGAHADHLVSRGDQVMNGADDDGSGSMMMLELAEAILLSPVRPRRSIVFGWWMGEEIGLYGSTYYANNPVFPLEKTVALIQLDMIGRNEEILNDRLGLPQTRSEDNTNTIHMIGYSYSSDMRNFIDRANEEIKLEIKYDYDTGPQGLIRRSDHWPFLNLGVPVAFMFSGFHPDYHQPTDTWDKINYPKFVRIGKMLFRTIWDLANTDDPPKLDPEREPGGLQ